VGVNRNGVNKKSFPLEKRLKPIVTNQLKSVNRKWGAYTKKYKLVRGVKVNRCKRRSWYTSLEVENIVQ
jgi:hypothetical protein